MGYGRSDPNVENDYITEWPQPHGIQSPDVPTPLFGVVEYSLLTGWRADKIMILLEQYINKHGLGASVTVFLDEIYKAERAEDGLEDWY